MKGKHQKGENMKTAPRDIDMLTPAELRKLTNGKTWRELDEILNKEKKNETYSKKRREDRISDAQF